MDDNPYHDDREEVRAADMAAAEERADRLIAEWNRRSGVEPKPRQRVKAGRRVTTAP